MLIKQHINIAIDIFYTHDQFLDIFTGGHSQPQQYPSHPILHQLFYPIEGIGGPIPEIFDGMFPLGFDGFDFFLGSLSGLSLRFFSFFHQRREQLAAPFPGQREGAQARQPDFSS